MPYDYPSGPDLRRIICSQQPHPRKGVNVNIPGSLQSLGGHDQSAISHFTQSLSRSGVESVDAFLELRPEFQRIGKQAIALALDPCETGHLFLDGDGRWYRYLYSQIRPPRVEDLSKNALSIVTFNYDRSLTHFLHVALQHSFDLKPEEAASALADIPIVHVHGVLGRFPWETESDPSRDYGQRIDGDEMLASVTGLIRVAHEDSTGDPAFSEARRLIEKAEVICFLGCAFHKANLERIGVLKFGALEVVRTKTIMGTAFGLEYAERQEIGSWFASHAYLGREDVDCAKFLRSRTVLRRPRPSDRDAREAEAAYLSRKGAAT